MVWVYDTSNAIRDEHGEVLYTQGIQMVITERKQAEAKINAQMDELRRWQNITLGREDRILQLKSEVNRLLGETGKPPRYASVVEKKL
jgi:hypothetical protein